MKGFEQGSYEGNGKADNVEIATLDARYPSGSAALDGVRTRLVHWFPGGDIGFDLGVRQGEEADSGDFGGDLGGLGSNDSDAGNDMMGATGELPQHAHGVGGIFGLGEDQIIEGDGGIGAEDNEFPVGGSGIWVGAGLRFVQFAKYGLSFFAGEAGDICEGSFAGERIFGHMGGMNDEGKAGLGE